MAGLNEKQRAFCHAYMANEGCAWKAYETAYGRGNNSDDSLRTLGQRALARPHVQAYLEELRAPAKGEAQQTLASILKELDENREVARSLGQASAMNAATLGKAKLLGYDKSQEKPSDDMAKVLSDLIDKLPG